MTVRIKSQSWVAMDFDGDWFLYPEKPQFDGDQWRWVRSEGDDRDVVELSRDLFDLPTDVSAENSLIQVT